MVGYSKGNWKEIFRTSASVQFRNEWTGRIVMPGRVLAPSVMKVVLVAGAQRPKRSTQGPARCTQRTEKGQVAGRRMPVDLQGWRMTKVRNLRHQIVMCLGPVQFLLNERKPETVGGSDQQLSSTSTRVFSLRGCWWPHGHGAAASISGAVLLRLGALGLQVGW